VLLERGAVLSAQHINTLYKLESAVPLREIVAAGWMDLMRIEPTDIEKDYYAGLSMLGKEFYKVRHEHQLLLRGVHSNYPLARQAVLHTLLQTSLLADLVNIVLDYFDGGDEATAVVSTGDVYLTM